MQALDEKAARAFPGPAVEDRQDCQLYGLRLPVAQAGVELDGSHIIFVAMHSNRPGSVKFNSTSALSQSFLCKGQYEAKAGNNPHRQSFRPVRILELVPAHLQPHAPATL